MSGGRSDKQPIRYRKLDDAALVQLAKQELPYRMRAYEELLERHEGVLYAVCLRLVGNRQDAEEIAQDVMLKIFTAIQGFEGRASYKTWLLRIAKNACYDRIKKRATSARYAEAIRNEPQEYSETEYEENRILDLMQQLEQKDREVLTLRYVADLSLNEVADSAELTLSAAKMRLYRATEKLRKLALESGIED